MQLSKIQLIKEFLIVCLCFCPVIAGCGSNGGSSEHVNIPEDSGTNETEIVQGAYNIFVKYYFDNDLVQVPYEGQTLESYVDSYRSPDDIYTKYLDSSEISDLINRLETEENLVVRWYSPSILYIAFDKFVQGTAERVTETINFYITQEGCDKLIFDLRVNGGGSIDESTAILDYFVTNVPIETTLCRIAGQQIDEEYKLGDSSYLYGNEDVFDSSNMYILTSSYTGSAAEILVFGLTYFDEATQIGSTTFGKNRVISYFKHKRGDGFFITRAIVYHADNIDREGIGITPEFDNLTTDPFIAVTNILDIDAPDLLQKDWLISDDALSYLYSQSYWRDKVYYACVFPSIRILQQK